MSDLSQIKVRGVLYDIKDAVARRAVGGPNMASTVAEMLDTSLVYIYTGSETGYINGNWYYYDGSDWTSGGVYNSAVVETDVSLSVSGAPADAKATGDAIAAIPPVDNSLTKTGEAADAKVTGDELYLLKTRYENLSTDLSTGVDGAVYDSAGNAVRGQLAEKVSDGYVEEGVAYFTNGEEVLFSITGIGGGGGGGGGGAGNNAVISISNTTGWISKAVPEGATVVATFTWSSIEDEMPTGAGTMSVRINGITKVNRTVQQGSVSVDLSSMLNSGANAVKISVSDVYGNSKAISLSISVVSLTITSSFVDSTVYTSAFDFPYVPTGSYTKTVYFKVDGTVIGTDTVSTSGRQVIHTIPAQTHGAHTLECYFTAEINGETVESNHLYYSFMYAVSGNDTVIISSAFNTTSVAKYSMISIPYYVYDPTDLTTSVTLKIDGTTVNTLVADRTLQTWTYRAVETGQKVFTIQAGGVTKSFTVTITASDIDVEAETSALALYLTSTGRSNSETNPATWTYENISATFSNFNFSSDGWKLDNENNTVLRVTGDARLTIPYQIFASDFRTTGKTIEFEFEAKDVRDYDTEIITCYSGGRGIVITPMKVTLTSEQSSISTQFKDDEHVRIAFVVEKRTEHRLLYCYINGIISGVIQYADNDNFAQISPVGISVGSSSATVDIYNIRIYDNNLTKYQMLTNWIADTQNVELMIERYNRNNVFNEYGSIVIEKLPSTLPYLILECPELPQYKGDKKSNISGTYVDPMDASKSFTFTGAQIDVQGTSSQYYARKNYKIKFKNGFTMTQSGNTESGFAMRGSSGSIPTNTFTFKADVASSEGANNVELVRLYNDTCPYSTPAQQEDERVRQGIDGFPIVMFWNDGVTTSFLGKYNFNNDKGTEEVFGFTDGDESWEILNNNSTRVIWENTDYTGTDWLNDFEARYPDTDPAYTDATQLSAMATWINSTKNNPTKFKQELSSHMEVDSVLFYYLFTELFLMVDSRAKNAFPSFIGGDI